MATVLNLWTTLDRRLMPRESTAEDRQSPELLRKEIWTHILAYNLIRTIIAQAAAKHEVEPRTISFEGAIQTLEAFQPAIAMQGSHNTALRARPYEQLLEAIVLHRVADRPDRYGGQ